jgi:catechol 2,3-dioxygenase-like lactoylglutathione lyase family enzyme
VFDHVTLRVGDFAASGRFYRTVLSALGIEPDAQEEGFLEWEDFSLLPADAEIAPTTGLHVGFVAPDRAAIDRFHAAGLAAGYQDAGAPGPRPQYLPDYYGAFLLDPDGNSVEAVLHGESTPHGQAHREGYVDHLWIGVRDVATAKRFYVTLAPHTGFTLDTDRPERASFHDAHASFSVVADGRPLTRNLHVAFPAGGRATVDAFHAAALAAGYRDNGPPGERPHYHPGYYGGFVLDPDGINVEVVFHQR